MRIRTLISTLLVPILCSGFVGAQLKPTQAQQASVLSATQAQKLFPASVFFKGQTAPTQGRNSTGVRLADQRLVLVALVDNSGYSSQDQGKYQAYLLTEAPLEIDGHKLLPGAYGCGFTNGNNFVAMDLSGHDLLSAHSQHDADLRRPVPLHMEATERPGVYRLYAGRDFVLLQIAQE